VELAYYSLDKFRCSLVGMAAMHSLDRFQSLVVDTLVLELWLASSSLDRLLSILVGIVELELLLASSSLDRLPSILVGTVELELLLASSSLDIDPNNLVGIVELVLAYYSLDNFLCSLVGMVAMHSLDRFQSLVVDTLVLELLMVASIRFSRS